MALVQVNQLDTTCYLSDYARGLLKKALEAENEVVPLPLGLRHNDNYIISMTEAQIKVLTDASRIVGRATVKITFSLNQLKGARRITRGELTPAAESVPLQVDKIDLDRLSFSELAMLYERVTATITKKMEADKASVSTSLQSCKISYNEDIYCQTCKKKTKNGEGEIVEEKGKHRVYTDCACGARKDRLVTVNKEIQEGIISFL